MGFGKRGQGDSLFMLKFEFSQEQALRLRTERVGWLSTVRTDGQPETSPVWFFWDGEILRMYSRWHARRLRNVETNPRGCFHLDGDGKGGSNIIMDVEISRSDRDVVDDAEFVGKYRDMMLERGWDVASFSDLFSAALTLSPVRVRAW